MVTSEIEEMTIKGTLDKELIYYLKQQQATPLGIFYLLPKIHKLDDQTIERVKAGVTTNNDPHRKSTPGHFSTWKSDRGSIFYDKRSHFSSVENVSLPPKVDTTRRRKVTPVEK